MSDLQRYDDFAMQHEAAYAAFTKIYETKIPPPERQAIKQENTLIVGALICLVFASVIVSGSRTINEFGGGFIGFAAFVMLELGIVAYAYIRTRIDYNEGRHAQVATLVNRGLMLAFAVAVAANLHAVLKENGIEFQPANVVIFILIGFSAPVLAFISGDVAGMLSAVDAVRQRRADQDYAVLLSAWRTDLNVAWKREQSKYGVKIEVSAPVSEADGQTGQKAALPSVVRPADVDADGRGHGYGQGYTKRTDARDKVRAHLNDFPNDLKLTVRELAEKIGVGKSTVSEVVREFKPVRQKDRTDTVEAASAGVLDIPVVIDVVEEVTQS